jgi:hypothetical protein
MHAYKSNAISGVLPTIEKGHEHTVMNQSSRFLLWLFYLYIISIPFNGYSLLNLGERGLARPDWLISGAILGLFSLKLATGRLQLRLSPVSVFVVFFIYTGVLSAINLFNASNDQFIDFATKAAQLLLVLPVFFVVSSLPAGEEELRTGLRIWIFAALVTSVYAVYQLFARVYGWPFAYIELTNPSVAYGGDEARVYDRYAEISSFLREPSYLGAYLIGPILLCSVFLLNGKGHVLLTKSSILNWTLLAVLALALLLSGSQGAYVTLIATIGIMYATNRISRNSTTKLVMIFLVLLLASGVLLASLGVDFFGALSLRLKFLLLNIMDPAGTSEVTSFRVRAECSLAALGVWIAHPILGVGLNNMSYYTDVCDFTLGWGQLLVDQGMLGFIALILVFWALLRGLSRLSKEPSLSPFWSLVIVGLIFVLISDIVNGAVCYNWVDPQRWFSLGIANLVYIQANSRLSKSVQNVTQFEGAFPEFPDSPESRRIDTAIPVGRRRG